MKNHFSVTVTRNMKVGNMERADKQPTMSWDKREKKILEHGIRNYHYQICSHSKSIMIDRMYRM